MPRDVVDGAIAETGRGARRAGGKLPPHVVVYLVMALALFGEDDYEEVAARLTETLRGWGCWGEDWEAPTKGAITQARKRLPEPMAQVFSQVAGPSRTWIRPGRSWAVAADVGGRDGMGRPGHGPEPGFLRGEGR